MRDCPKHGLYCMYCDEECGRCAGCYKKNGVMHHKCSRVMNFCSKHKKYYCAVCGQKCKLCKNERKSHTCGEIMHLCERHDKEYCYLCHVHCEDCKKEDKVALEKGHIHHCLTPMLYCAKHKIYFCPACDNLCSCGIHCGLIEKYYDDKEFNVKNEIEWKWEDFQEWLRSKDEFMECMEEFQETWEEFIKCIFALLFSCGNDPAVEQVTDMFAVVDNVFRRIAEVTLRIKGYEEEVAQFSEEEMNGINGMMSWLDEDGQMQYKYNKPMRKRIEVIEYKDNTLIGYGIRSK